MYKRQDTYTPYRGWIPKFIYSAIEDEPYTVYLGHKRTLEYVEDLSRAFANIIDNFKASEVYNFGGGEQYTIKYVSDLILKYVGKDDSMVTYEEDEPFTTRIKTPDPSRAERDLDFKLTVPVDEGLKRTVEWFKSYYRK